MWTVELPYQENGTAYFQAIRDLPYPIWLDSQNSGRYDILVADPCELFTTQDRPFEALSQVFACDDTLDLSVPFAGGLVGLWGYDLARKIETICEVAKPAYILPDMLVGWYDWAIVIDHERQQTQLVSLQRHPRTSAQWSALVQRLENISIQPLASFHCGAPHSNMTQAEYTERFARIQAYIHAGDCYQVNLAQRFHMAFDGDPFAAYCHVREHTHVPFGAYVETPQGSVLSFSLEQFLAVSDRNVVTKPIKGTTPRGKTPVEDDQLAQQLLTSQKDHAENVMIVDLLRNDLSRVCQAHSVRVPHLFTLERFANVHHLVSTVEGVLAEDKTVFDLLAACFPGGSITGAPKCRVMDIIEELELDRRSIYCGSIGYIGYDGRMDSSICIRTMLYENDILYAWAGGGIIADSQVETEYQETYAKISNIFAALK